MKYCHVFMAPWLTVIGWLNLLTPSLQSLVITISYNNSQSVFSRTLLPWPPRTRSILILSLIWVRVRIIATDGQSVSLSWCRAPSGAHDQILITVWQLRSCPWEGALSDERTSLSFVSQSTVLGQLSVSTIFTFYMCHMLLNTYTIYIRPLSVRVQYSRLCPISGSFPITAV
jgi:hypothetical protein